jgi:hypothetical protein
MHDWIDTNQVTTKAAKRDDATTAIDMWNKRLSLLYTGCSPSVQDILRKWLLNIVRRNLTRSLGRYLAQEFGADWSVILSTCRQMRVRYRCSRQFRDNLNAYLCRRGKGRFGSNPSGI